MPKKGHKAASRQAQIRRKKRRGRPRTEEFAVGPATPPADMDDELDEAVYPPRPAATDLEARPRTRRQLRLGPQQAYTLDSHNYLGGELKQAGIITILIGAILAVLTVLLG